jgi:hypothetical protein
MFYEFRARLSVQAQQRRRLHLKGGNSRLAFVARLDQLKQQAYLMDGKRYASDWDDDHEEAT